LIQANKRGIGGDLVQRGFACWEKSVDEGFSLGIGKGEKQKESRFGDVLIGKEEKEANVITVCVGFCWVWLVFFGCFHDKKASARRARAIILCFFLMKRKWRKIKFPGAPLPPEGKSTLLGGGRQFEKKRQRFWEEEGKERRGGDTQDVWRSQKQKEYNWYCHKDPCARIEKKSSQPKQHFGRERGRAVDDAGLF